MTVETLMHAAVLRLSRSDVKALRITDGYSLHRVVYDLFADVRSENEKQASLTSGILYADKGGDFHQRLILLLSDRMPNLTPAYGEVACKTITPQFLQHQQYTFEIVINPTRRDSKSGKLVAVRGREPIADWFVERAAASWGFRVNRERLEVGQMSVQRFVKNGHPVTHGSAVLKGVLDVVDQERFQESFCRGIGRGRAFGFGLLQIVPC